jgi:hypothetical protein
MEGPRDKKRKVKVTAPKTARRSLQEKAEAGRRRYGDIYAKVKEWRAAKELIMASAAGVTVPQHMLDWANDVNDEWTIVEEEEGNVPALE